MALFSKRSVAILVLVFGLTLISNLVSAGELKVELKYDDRIAERFDSIGGSMDKSNLAACCRDCNAGKGT